MPTYERPGTLRTALHLMQQQHWRLLAGGTDFYPAVGDAPVRQPVLDITAIGELGEILHNRDGLRIGALVTWTDILHSKLPNACRALQLAAVEVGSIQIQNRATVVGNLCNASPAADGVPALLALDASVEIASANTVRSMPLADFIQGNRRTALAADEMVVALHLPLQSLRGTSDFLKLGARKYLVISIAMVAVRIEVADGHIVDAALAVGSCSEVACRLPLAEAALKGAAVDQQPAQLIRPQHLSSLAPLSDIRASADYRRLAALTLLQRSVVRVIGA